MPSKIQWLSANFRTFCVQQRPGTFVCIRRDWGYFWGYRADTAKGDTPNTSIRSAKGEAKADKMVDGGGLHVLVNANGSRLWRWKYRFGGAGSARLQAVCG
ncbi:Arm DNA-binding domain-containing protein [Methylobrevis albus]|uniref:Arm DNA-binding domain-containing protein n=1 Tax=Methylobrevis albus TaxID=2793297 RepID=UPI002E2CE60C|nr:Arm DNA-binding domain-containing protein [Methylobrevis albus]